MAMISSSALCFAWKGCNGCAIVAVLLLVSSFSRGFNVEETKSSLSSLEKNIKPNISIHISESVKYTKTDRINVLKENKNYYESATITSTELLPDSSIIEAEIIKEKPINRDIYEKNTVDDWKKNVQLESSFQSADYYEAIVPTKTFSGKEEKITATNIMSEKSSGEVKGVSMKVSRPQKKEEAMNYNRIKREFGKYVSSNNEDTKVSLKNDHIEDNLKVKEKINARKNYNHIEQTLEKIAKITKNEDGPEKSPKVSPTNFRESREEENRKASPDIQDIITGIVNILNGKGSKSSDVHAVRPNRPTSTRINNRGPPRISDVPPLDFDNPPPYRPLPPLPSKKVPLPYPFDLPPSMPNIPLPPQPQKPNVSKLPSHPFIDGVPLPELVIPNSSTKKPSKLKPEFIQTGFDTISSSEPQNNQNFHSVVDLSTTPKPEVSQSTLTNTHSKNESIPTKNTFNNFNKSTIPFSGNNTTIKPDHKAKPSGQKISNSNTFIKNSNKRVKPALVPSVENKPPINKTSSTTPIIKSEKNKTEIIKGHFSVEKKNLTTVAKTESEITTKNQSSNTALLKEITNNSKIMDTEKDLVKTSVNLMLETPTSNLETKINTTEAIHSTSIKATETTLPQFSTTIHNGTEKIEFDFEIPVLLEPSDGIGEATPVLETSILELSLLPTEHTKTPVLDLNTASTHSSSVPASSSSQYKVRPGIVLDDPEYKPGQHKRPSIATKPIITAPPPNVHYGEIFDVTVHAIQGPGEKATGKPYVVPGDIDGIHVQNSQVLKNDVSVITKPEDGQNFVSIDGKRTYINLFGDVSPTKINPTSSQPSITGTGYIIPHKENPTHQSSRLPPSTSPPRRPPYKKPSHPPVRIDTCIVGDDTTCDSAQNEICKTEDGVSSCHCRPGYNRRKHRDTCRRVVSVLTSIRVDRLYDKKVEWQDNLKDPESEAYQQLSYEASQAIESAMSMTPFSDDFINSRINSIYSAKNLENNQPAVYVNLTIQLEENLDTVRPAVKQDIQRHLMRVIQRRNNNVGHSAVWVDDPPGSILALQDVDECSSSELHDCHERAICLNTFGNFKCQCPEGLRDPWVGNIHREGRFCEACSPDFCNNRGECMYERGQQVCHCSGSFYGTQCEIDGEVLGVAIGASVAAAIIIILTLVCLCMWSRRWSKEQKSAVGIGMGSPVFGYMASGPTVKTPNVGAPPYQVTIEDRIRWAQIADVMAKANHYAQPEPVNTTSRSKFGGYSTLQAGTLPLPSIAPPVPLPRLSLANKPPIGTYGVHSQFGSLHQGGHGIRSSLETTSSSEEEDRTDLLGRNFNVPRPKSRASVANQSGIYYDVDYDRTDACNKQNTIPMNTYTLNPQHQVRPYFR